MKAIVLSKYGSSEFLEIKEVLKPIPKEKEVLIKVHTTAVNDYDWSMVIGKPYIYRLMYGLFKPKHSIPGMELSGTVEALGNKANKFKVGEPVFGDISNFGFGTFAEFVSVHEDALLKKPEKMSFEEAASLPHAALLAYQGLRDKGQIQQGSKVLINGAGGGVGTFGLQLAKLYGANVTGVDTGKKLAEMKSLGFDHIIDYKQEDFTKNGKQYDLVLDAKTNRLPQAYLRALRTNGKYVSIGGQLGKLLLLLLFKFLNPLFSKKKLEILALKPNKGLADINEFFEAGKIKCIIDGPYPLAETPKALQYFGESKHTGKVLISVIKD